MALLKKTEWRKLDSIFEMNGGYCLDFSNKTLSEFFEDELGIEIYDDRYSFNGESKAKLVRGFIEVEDGSLVADLLTKMWGYKISIDSYASMNLTTEKEWLFELIGRLAAGAPVVASTRLSQQAKLLNLDTVSRDLNRALNSASNDPESALTSACSTIESVCRSILVELGEELPKTKDIKSLYKAVRSPLGLTPNESKFPSEITNDVLKIMGGLATVVEGIGSLRTHAGDAHGREKGHARVDSRIASLAVHSASSLALFLIDTWQRRYPSKNLHIHPYQ